MNRSLRFTVGLPPLFALWLLGALIEIADTALSAFHHHTKRAVLRLRDWMDCPR